ncbi:MAG: divergent PAP2 family protein [Treponema lecithinolyticum]|uniref:divergent PAP2 family protein n=1 Tax=Treponema lecithinolyticum TaxID=53418 RepID=UPI003618D800
MFFTVRKQLYFLLTNPVFLSALFSWLSAQFIKTVIQLLTGKVSDFKELIALLFWRTGGMPSSHSALVCAMSAAIGFRSGVNSDIFVLACCFTLVVIRDALGVRRASGLQARTLNEVGKELHKKNIIEFQAVKEVHGHKPLEVFVGCLLGLFIGAAFSVL